MLDWFTTNPALALLKKDHEKVKTLFDEFDKAEGRPAKKKIVDQAVAELKVHAAIEEELFYPAVRPKVGSDLMNEADEEHHVAKILIAELEELDGHGDHYDAKFTVLSENIRHHIKEEEGDVFAKAKQAELNFEQLAEAMQARKDELTATGVPPVAEEAMVAASHGTADSPAQAAHSTAKKTVTRKKAASKKKAPAAAKKPTKKPRR